MYQHYLTDKRLCYEDEGVKLNMLTGKRIKDIKAWNLKVSLCPPFLLYGLKLILCNLQMYEMQKQNVCNQQMCNILKQNVEAKEAVLADVQSRDKLNLAITSNQATTTIQRIFLLSISRSLESLARHRQSLDFSRNLAISISRVNKAFYPQYINSTFFMSSWTGLNKP